MKEKYNQAAIHDKSVGKFYLGAGAYFGSLFVCLFVWLVGFVCLFVCLFVFFLFYMLAAGISCTKQYTCKICRNLLNVAIGFAAQN